MASKILSLLALGSLGTAAAVQPAVSEAIAFANEAQVSMLQVQMQDKLLQLATSQLTEELGLEADFISTLKDAMSVFGKQLLTSLKPTVSEVCSDIVKQVADFRQTVEEDQPEADFGLVETSHTRLTDIAPHHAKTAVSMVEQQFWDSAKKALKEVARGIKQAATPVISKVKEGIQKALSDMLQKLKPTLQRSLAEMIATVCDKAKEHLENDTKENVENDTN